MKTKLSSLLLGAIVLIAALAIYNLPRTHYNYALEHSRINRLEQIFPKKMPGVIIQDLPLGITEYADKFAREKLDYDDVVYRSYANGNITFTVYVAYWKAGKFSPSYIAAHTPDRCWTMAGMTCLDFQNVYLLRIGSEYLSGAMWRKFSTQDGKLLYVVYWHIVGNNLYDYGGKFNSYTEPLIRVKNVIGDLFAPHGDQYFIRLTSDRAFEQLITDQAFQEILTKLKFLGLMTDPQS